MVVSKQQCDSLPGQQGHSHFHFFQQQSDNRAARSSRTRPGKLVGSCQQVFVNNSFPSGLYFLNQCFSREPKRSRGRSEGAKARGSGGRVEVVWEKDACLIIIIVIIIVIVMIIRVEEQDKSNGMLAKLARKLKLRRGGRNRCGELKVRRPSTKR